MLSDLGRQNEAYALELWMLLQQVVRSLHRASVRRDEDAGEVKGVNVERMAGFDALLDPIRVELSVYQAGIPVGSRSLVTHP